MSSSTVSTADAADEQNPNVGVAFALVIGAGAATAVGASVVFFPALVKLASRRVLAGALGLSAGVMTYVSFVEIFSKSNLSFLDAGHSEQMAYVYATLCFFAGVVTMLVIDFFVKCLSGGHHHHHHHDQEEVENDESCHSNEKCESEVDFVTTPHCACASEDPLHEWDEWKKRAEEELQHEGQGGEDAAPTSNVDDTTTDTDVVKVVDAGLSTQAKNVVANAAEVQAQKDELKRVESQEEEKEEEDLKKPSTGSDSDNDKKSSLSVVDMEQEDMDEGTTKSPQEQDEAEQEREREEHRRLIHMGINTALAIGLHNFPEGLATFVAALDDPRVGAVLAVAIGIHNIPEGLCVALPIYYATGNRCKAFMWACVSGISEPIAALLGWAVLANSFSDDLYAILFGIVAGMMVVISTKELLPTAHRYDPDDTVVTYSYIGGMCIMALSLVLFVI